MFIKKWFFHKKRVFGQFANNSQIVPSLRSFISIIIPFIKRAVRKREKKEKEVMENEKIGTYRSYNASSISGFICSVIFLCIAYKNELSV